MRHEQQFRPHPSGLPSLSDNTEHLSEDWVYSELFDERQQPVFGHGRDELIEHDALPQQRVGAPLGGVGLEQPVSEAERFPGGAEQGQQGDREGVEQPQPVAAGGGADAHLTHAHAVAEVLGCPGTGIRRPSASRTGSSVRARSCRWCR